MTKILFVRHGEAVGNIERKFHGWTNSALTENGKKQVQCLAERLKEEHIDAIYSSDLTRAYETAQAIAAYHPVKILIDESFREINGGEWEGVAWEDLPKVQSESYHNWLTNLQKLQMPGGESMVEFQKRLVAGVERVILENPDKTVVVATHGTAIRVLMCYYKGIGLEHASQQMWHDNASITTVEFCEGEKPCILVEGDNAHLGELSTFAKQNWWREEFVEGNREQ